MPIHPDWLYRACTSNFVNVSLYLQKLVTLNFLLADLFLGDFESGSC